MAGAPTDGAKCTSGRAARLTAGADANRRQIQRLLEAGASAYLTKPLDVHKLAENVDALLRERTPI